MSENIKDLYSKIEFLVNGGALKSLTDFLNEKNIKALVVEKNVSDTLNVIDAAGIVPESLTLNDSVSKYFNSGVVKESFEIEFSEASETWPLIVKIKSSHWDIYILFKEKIDNPKNFIEELKPYAGLINLWKTFSSISETEKKLSRLSYMILATKSTLASIFEPMPLQYFASFLADVLQESLFPKSIAILKDDGNKLTLLHGKLDNIPERKGIFENQILPPAPVILKNSSPFEIVLPVAEDDLRLFCLIQWEYLPDDQTMNFLELLGNLAVRAVAINNLRSKSHENEVSISTRDFTVLSLSNVLKILREAENKDKFFSLLLDIFKEQSRMEAYLLSSSKDSEAYKYSFSIGDEFIALESGQEGITTLNRSQLASLDLIAQFAAHEFGRFN